MTDDPRLRRVLHAIYQTPEIEIDCTTCLDHVATYVDTELLGRDAAREMPDLAQHLALCGDCYEEYVALRELAALDAGQGLPARGDLLRLLAERREQT